MKIFAVAMMLLVTPELAIADSIDKQCSSWAHKIAHGSAEACSDLCPQAQKFDHYDYRGGLKSAFSTQRGLDRFLAYLNRSSIIGAGAEAHACSVRALLVHWGDLRFSASLLKQSTKAKEQAIDLLDYTGIKDFKLRFPKTYQIAPHGQ